MSTTDHFQFSFPSRFLYVRSIRLFVGDLARSIGFEPEQIQLIETMVDEAVTNAVEHGSPKYSDNKVAVSIALDYEKIAIEVIDEGLFASRLSKADILEKFGPPQLHQINQVNAEKRGRGLFLMAKLADQLEIKPLPGDQGTSVMIVKYRSANTAARSG